MKTTKNIFSFLFLSLLFFSCRRDVEKANWDVDALAPLIKTSLNLEDLLPDSILQTNPDTSLKLVYQENIFDVNVDSLFQIPDTTVTDVYSIPFSSTVAPGGTFYSEAEEYGLNVNNGVGLNYAEIESGYIEVEIISEVEERIIVTYTIPSATKNGDTLVLNDVVNAASPGNPAVYSRLINISGYNLDLTGISKAEVNTLVTRAVAIVDTNALNPVNLVAGQKITFNNKLMDIVPFFVRGYFGNQFYNYADATSIAAFDMIAGGTLDIEAVDVDIEFRNGIGVDAQMVINQFGTRNTNSITSADLSHSVIGSPININRSVLTGSVPEVTYTNYLIDVNTTNSNIDQLIELFPNELIYDIDLIINPLGNVSGNNDFVYKKHVLEANLNVEFPLSLIANNLTLQDTVSFSLTEQSETGRINDGTLFIYANNGFPFDAVIQMDLYDELGNYLQALDVSSIIQAAPVNTNLRVTSKRESALAIPLDKVAIDNLYQASNMVVRIGFTTIPQAQYIKIYEEYAIDLKVVGDFSYNFVVE